MLDFLFGTPSFVPFVIQVSQRCPIDLVHIVVVDVVVVVAVVAAGSILIVVTIPFVCRVEQWLMRLRHKGTGVFIDQTVRSLLQRGRRRGRTVQC